MARSFYGESKRVRNDRIKRELGIPNAPVVGTGGLARTVSAATDLFSAVDPDLTLRGIREIWLHQQH